MVANGLKPIVLGSALDKATIRTLPINPECTSGKGDLSSVHDSLERQAILESELRSLR